MNARFTLKHGTPTVCVCVCVCVCVKTANIQRRGHMFVASHFTPRIVWISKLEPRVVYNDSEGS